MQLFVGSYTTSGGPGVLRLAFDEKTGKLEKLGASDAFQNPSYLTLSPDETRLYAACEQGDATVIAAFALCPERDVTPINEARFPGAGTCHLRLSPDGRFIAAANFGSGSVVTAKINADGSVGALVSQVVYMGQNEDPARQNTPYAHCVLFTPDSRFMLAADLGTDSVWRHSFDAATGILGAPVRAFHLPEGEGPRHLAFDAPRGRLLVNSEMGNKLYVFEMDEDSGALTLLHAMPALSPGFTGRSTSAALKLSADGRYAAMSHRGEDSVAVFKLADTMDGAFITSPTGGQSPRDFAFSPDGRYAAAAHQDSGTLVMHRFCGETGRLTEIVCEAAVKGAVCAVFARNL